MTPDHVLAIGSQALWIMLVVAAPLLASALVVGLVVSVLQAATQVNEMTLAFIPKLVALAVTLVVAGPWMLDTLAGYMRELIERIPALIG